MLELHSFLDRASRNIKTLWVAVLTCSAGLGIINHMEIVMTYDHMSSLRHAYGRPRNFGSCGSRQMILTVDWLISHQSPCLNDDGPEGRQVVYPGVSLISMSILDFSLFSEPDQHEPDRHDLSSCPCIEKNYFL